MGGGESEDGDTKDKDEEAERERLEAIKEAEDRRKEKHRKMEEEREKMRQDIRDKVHARTHTHTLLPSPRLLLFICMGKNKYCTVVEIFFVVLFNRSHNEMAICPPLSSSFKQMALLFITIFNSLREREKKERKMHKRTTDML